MPESSGFDAARRDRQLKAFHDWAMYVDGHDRTTWEIERRDARALFEQLEAARSALYRNGHRPPGTPGFHLRGCTGCAALAGYEPRRQATR